MSNDIAFLAEFADGQPARSALELAAGAAQLAKASGGAAVGLAYGSGAKSGAAGSARPALRRRWCSATRRSGHQHGGAAGGRGRPAGPQVLLAPATLNGRDLAAALVGLLACPRSARSRAAAIRDGRLRVEQATLQGTAITVSEPVDDAPQPAVVLVLANTFTPVEGGSGRPP